MTGLCTRTTGLCTYTCTSIVQVEIIIDDMQVHFHYYEFEVIHTHASALTVGHSLFEYYPCTTIHLQYSHVHVCVINRHYMQYCGQLLMFCNNYITIIFIIVSLHYHYH